MAKYFYLYVRDNGRKVQSKLYDDFDAAYADGVAAIENDGRALPQGLSDKIINDFQRKGIEYQKGIFMHRVNRAGGVFSV